MFEYFNEKSINAINAAQEEARRSGRDLLGTEYILLGLLLVLGKDAEVLFGGVEFSADRFRQKIEEKTGKGTRLNVLRIPFTPKAKKMFEEALQISRQLNSQLVEPEHILLAITSDPQCLAARIIQEQGIDLRTIQLAITDMPQQEFATPISNKKTNSPRDRLSVISKYGKNLTEKALEGKLDPVIGRSTEVQRVLQILARRTKNNPILLGEPGVGKTAIAEGIAQRLLQADTPDFLRDKQIVSLEIATLLAGTRLRGEMEERIKAILAEVLEAENIILFIDEIHTIVGAGAQNGGGLDIANIFKPALSRGQLQCIGATTQAEYRQYIESDAALERRFQPVKVGEPSAADTLEILNGLRKIYEDFHKVKFTNKALEAAVSLSDRYISDRFLPDKAIDLLDEAGSRVHLRYSLANKKQSDSLINPSSLLPLVDKEEIAEIVSSWTNIPLQDLTRSQSETLLNLESHLHKKVIAQDEAIEAVSKAIRRSRVSLQSANRPLGSFIFAGPTGVGKTELAKALASFLFGSAQALIRLDMSEFMESHTISKLIGSPPGFVGYGEGGQLSEAVRRKPYSVILLDEIEKAHPDVFNLFLQVLDDGRLTDSQGRVVNFQNTLIIMTSNLGSAVIEKGGSSLGFELSGNSDYTQLSKRVMEDFKGYFRPEFLNRIDEIIIFRSLQLSEIAQIADLLLADVANQIAQQRQIVLEFSPAFRDLIVEEGYSPAHGARQLRRVITKRLEDALAEAILQGIILDNSKVIVDLDEQGNVLVCPQKQAVLNYQTVA